MHAQFSPIWLIHPPVFMFWTIIVESHEANIIDKNNAYHYLTKWNRRVTLIQTLAHTQTRSPRLSLKVYRQGLIFYSGLFSLHLRTTYPLISCPCKDKAASTKADNNDDFLGKPRQDKHVRQKDGIILFGWRKK